jgi:outer membrane protein, heavy metal efflux system
VERLEVLAGQRERVKARMNSLLNRPPDSPLREIPTFMEVTIEVPFSLERLYLTARERNPEIDADRLEIQKASLERERAGKDFLPDFTVSAGYFQRGGFGSMYEYTVGVEIPLYWRRKESRAVEERVEAREAARHEYHRRLQEITFTIKDAYIGARTSRRLLELYRTGIIPQATAALDSSLSSYQVGAADFLTLTNNALTILTYELQYAAELRDYHENLVTLERQLGVNLVGEAGRATGPRP